MQTALVIIIVGVATIYLGWEFYKKFFSKKAECDDCAVSKLSEK